ncbi:hypothetical protein CTAYLR_007693 [Chrysophaeum taylorii]|uniref:Alpha/beta hydrolase fold-3 domain-containing protein n=1 Tax=Chrysophaeum taylorii TaxID=2483200 RepID=A0AAD7U706_9STRA|nr:hypothetical protein CTAYLR_007693 [Chrysophaeum taylorii]
MATRREEILELRRPSDSSPLVRLFAEQNSCGVPAKGMKRLAIVNSRALEDGLSATGLYTVLRDTDDRVALKAACEATPAPLVVVADAELGAAIKRRFGAAFVEGLDVWASETEVRTPFECVAVGSEGPVGVLLALHEAHLRELEEDERLPRSDPAVDALGPERVGLLDEAAVRRFAQRLYERDDGGDADLDRKRAAGVVLEVLPPGTVTPRWTRGDATRGACEVHVPERAPDDDDGTRILFLHGGANVCYSPPAYRPIASRLAALSGMVVVVPDYRLAPEHGYPSLLDDAEAALDWLAKNKTTRRVLVVGDSAGGALALSLALYRTTPSLKLVEGIATLSAWLDMRANVRSYQTRSWDGTNGDPVYNSGDPELERRDTRKLQAMYWNSVDPSDPTVHPFYAPARALATLPDLYMIVGDAEVLRDDTTVFARRARDAGVDVSLDIWPRLWHVFQMYSEGGVRNRDRQRRDPPLLEAYVSLTRLARWLHKQAGRPSRLEDTLLDADADADASHRLWPCRLLPDDEPRPPDDAYY